MDWSSIIVALITACGAFLGVYYANRKSQALIEYRLAQLERKVDKHNSVIERTYALEERATLLEEKVKVGNHRAVLSASGLAAVLSLLTSIATGLPEVEEGE